MSTIDIIRNTICVATLLIVISATPAFCQNHSTYSSSPSRKHLAKTTRIQEIAQEDLNITVQKMTLCELEIRALKFIRQIDALSTVPLSQSSQKQLLKLNQDLQRINKHIKSTKVLLSTDESLLEEKLSKLESEEAHATSLSYNNPIDLPEISNSIQLQNAQLRQDTVSAQKQVAERNLALLKTQRNDLQRQISSILPKQNNTKIIEYDMELELCRMLEKKISTIGYDIAEINLLVSNGLSGESINVGSALETLDSWAAWVKSETDRNMHKFKRSPKEYNNSESYFRILMMVCILQEDFKVRYNTDPKLRAGPVEIMPDDISFYENPKDLFINGITDSKRQGTCASLPVFYVAIGRRLGYPLKLVNCKGHLFARWEGTKERFNIEGTNRGLNCYPDDEYREWPSPISDEEMKTGMYLESLSPKRELATFLELRSLFLKQNGLNRRSVIVKSYADELRKKEGVDLDQLNELIRDYTSDHSGSSAGALLNQSLSNTNSWRGLGNKRGNHEKYTVFAVERFDAE